MSVLLERLVDDAGLFPPTALAPPDAVRRHRDDLAAGHPMHTHRLLVAAGRLAQVRAELRPDDRFRIGLIADGTASDDPGARLTAALATIEADPRLELALVEAPVAVFGPSPAAAVPVLLDAVHGTGVPLFLEPAAPTGIDDLLAALPRAPGRVIGAKLRCGGTGAHLFPGTDDVARFIAACVLAGVPFKATAGLHHAVRHRNPATGFTHHGYLNLLLATATACVEPAAPHRPGQDAVRAALELTDTAELADRIRALPATTAARARTLLFSYGSCSTGTPVNEAAAVLGLTRKDFTR
ncbi:hypothetical protein [Streptomyces shenzhenensis]|uniref:hypothetical protein n=1 Tax=Streptomyces shenzhenensis TaxID=943815 RepID=UPI00217D2B36|nr:hypothetical protein [Streptomyces shenzhenensis]